MRKSALALALIGFTAFFAPSHGIGQTKEDGQKIRKEAAELVRKARTKADLTTAVTKCEEALRIFEKIGFDGGSQVAAFDAAKIYVTLGQHQKAVERFEKARAISKKNGIKKDEAYCLMALGLSYSHLHQYAKAKDYLQQALAMQRALGEELGESDSLQNLGVVSYRTSDYRQAVAYYEEALAIKKRVGDRKGESSLLMNLGAVYHHWARYADALRIYEQCLELKKSINDRKGEALVVYNLGSVYKDTGNYAKASEYVDKALEIQLQTGDLKGQGMSLNALGVIHGHWGKLREAAGYYDRSLAIKRELNDISGEGATLVNLGALCLTMGQYQQAAEYFAKDFEIVKKTGDVKGQAHALNNLAAVHKTHCQWEKAAQCYEESLAITRKIADAQFEGLVLGNQAELFEGRGQYKQARQYYEKSLEIAEKLGQVKRQGSALTRLGSFHADRGRFVKAVPLYEKALALRKETGDVSGQAATLSALGEIYRKWGQYARAEEAFNEALSIQTRAGLMAGRASTLNRLGLTLAARGHYDRATDCYHKSLELYRQIGLPQSEATIVANLGSVYLSQGRYDKALESYQKALDTQRSLGLKVAWLQAAIGNVYLDLGDTEKAEPHIEESRRFASRGRLYLAKHDPGRAREQYEKLRKSAEKNRHAENLFIAFTGLGLALEAQGELKEAADSFRKAMEHTEEVRSALSESERSEFYNVRIGGFLRTAPYEGLARVLLKLNQPAESLKESEYAKARAFAEALGRRSTDSGLDVPADVLQKDSELNEERAALMHQRQDAFEKGNQEAIASLDPQLAALTVRFQEHVDALRSQFPLFASTKYPQPMALGQSALRDGEWIISYDVTDQGILMYLTRGKAVVSSSFKPVPRKEVDERVRKFRKPLEVGPEDSLAQKLSQFDFAAGKELADLLLGDVLALLPKGERVVIVPDDSLGVLPFEMLVLNDRGRIVSGAKVPCTVDTEFFGDRNPLSYYQSITALTLSRTLERGRKKGDRTLVVTDPVFSVEDDRLKDAAKHDKDRLMAGLPGQLMSIRDVAGLTFPRLPLTGSLGESFQRFDPAHTDVYRGLQAGKSVLSGKDLSGFRSLVFATHGYFGTDLPGIDEPVLVLTLVGQPADQDGFLRMSEVMGLRLNADVVALTACQSGLGRTVSGEGTMGMGRAFQYAGAGSVLMSLWSVAETSSVKLVESFFLRLREGKDKLEALRLAREQIRNDGYDHPFFWAAFVLTGATD